MGTIDGVEVVSTGRRVTEVGTEHYVLITFKDPSQLEAEEGEVDTSIELSESLVLANLSEDARLLVGEILAGFGEYFGYSQARDVLQGLYGAI